MYVRSTARWAVAVSVSADICGSSLFAGCRSLSYDFYLATSSCNGAPSTSRETLTPDLRLDRTPRAGTPWRLSCFSRRRLNDSRSLFEPWRSESIHILLRRLL